MRREIELGTAAHFRPIANTAGLGGIVSAAVGDLLAEAIDPRELAQATGRTSDASLIALSAIYTAYLAELERRRWPHPARAAAAAVDAVNAGVPLPGLVIVDGFHLFRGTEAALLEALAERSEVVVAIDPDSGARARHDYNRLRLRVPDAAGHRVGGADAGSARDGDRRRRGDPRGPTARYRPADQAAPHRRPLAPPLRLRRRVQAGVALPQARAAGVRRVQPAARSRRRRTPQRSPSRRLAPPPAAPCPRRLAPARPRRSDFERLRRPQAMAAIRRRRDAVRP